MSSGIRKLSSTGVRLLQDTGTQRISTTDDDCCCDGCWKISSPCICTKADQFQEVLYIPCELITGEIFFKGPPVLVPPPTFGESIPSNCYSVSPSSPEVTVLPDEVTEFTNITPIFEDCFSCCGLEEEDEACCFDDDENCEDLAPKICLELNGIPQGQDTECENIDCDPGGSCPAICNTCPQTVEVIFSGLGYIATSTIPSFFEDCVPPGTMINTYSGSIPINYVGGCQWFQLNEDDTLVFGGTCLNPPFSCDKVRMQFVNCIGNNWELRIVVVIESACNQAGTGAIDYFYRKPNTDDCPLGNYTFVSALPNDNFPPSWTVIPIPGGIEVQ